MKPLNFRVVLIHPDRLPNPSCSHDAVPCISSRIRERILWRQREASGSSVRPRDDLFSPMAPPLSFSNFRLFYNDVAQWSVALSADRLSGGNQIKICRPVRAQEHPRAPLKRPRDSPLKFSEGTRSDGHRFCGPVFGSIARQNKDFNHLHVSGAQERTRTFTAVKPLAPEASASTNSATWALRAVTTDRSRACQIGGRRTKYTGARGMTARRESAKQPSESL